MNHDPEDPRRPRPHAEPGRPRGWWEEEPLGSRRFPAMASRRRPHWWPEGEAWPPRHTPWMFPWHRRRRFFLMRVAGALLALFLIGGAVCTGTFWLLSQIGQNDQLASPLLMVVIAVGATALGTTLLAGIRGMILSFGDLVSAATRAEAGDFSARVAPRGPRELRAMGRAFNAMLERIERSASQRRDLLADVTHELRTPVTIIQGNLEGILDGVYPADEAHLRPALEEIRQLSRLIDDLRTLSLAEGGALELHREPTDLGELAEDVATSFHSLAQARGIELIVEAPSEAPLVEVDPVRIREVMVNLTANALRHTSHGGHVTIAASFNGKENRAEIAVRDSGEGIAPADLPLIFDRFYKSKDSEGTGLGLAIAKNLVAAHAGEISAESVVGKGTTIRFTLPTRPSTL